MLENINGWQMKPFSVQFVSYSLMKLREKMNDLMTQNPEEVMQN